jgi:hypothetical protein
MIGNRAWRKLGLSSREDSHWRTETNSNRNRGATTRNLKNNNTNKQVARMPHPTERGTPLAIPLSSLKAAVHHPRAAVFACA